MSDAPSPLDALLPLQKVLAANGVQANLWALVEACGGDLSLSSFADCARQQGVEATLLQLKPGDLAFLGIGTVVALEGGALATVVAHDPDGVVLERPDGTRQHVGQRSEVRPTLALHVRPAPPDGERLLARLATRLRDEPHAARAIALSALLALMLLVLGLAGPVLTRAALGSALPDRAQNTLALVAGGTAILGLQVAYVGWLRRRALLYLSTKLTERASLDLAAHMLRLPFARLRGLDVGTVQQAVGSASSAAAAIPAFAPQLVDGVLGLGYLAYTFFVDPGCGLVAAGAGLMMVLVGFFNGRKRLALRRELLAQTRAEQQCLYETLAGIETVKSESVEGRMLARWLDRVLAEEKAALDLRLQASTISTVLVSFNRIVFGAVLLFMARRCLASGASVADLIAAVQASAGFMASAQTLAQLPQLLAGFRGDVERADEMLVVGADKEGGASRPPDTRAPALVVRDMWFRYDTDSPWVLSGLDLVVQAGETMLFTWPSGAGKSTLLRILSGLLEPTRGDVLVFGMDAAQARRMVTYIPQQAALFPGSLMENLRILSRSAPHDRILAAARATGLHDLVSTWPMGFETVVSLGSANLSSGQRQLVLFTAAAASESPIVLLDEALAHVDLGMRAKLGGADLFRGRTVLAVAHDASPREAAGARLVTPRDSRSAAAVRGGLLPISPGEHQ